MAQILGILVQVFRQAAAKASGRARNNEEDIVGVQGRSVVVVVKKMHVSTNNVVVAIIAGVIVAKISGKIYVENCKQVVKINVPEVGQEKGYA